VRVVHGHDQAVGANQSTHRLQDIAITVIETLDRIAAAQTQQDTVDRQGLTQSIEQP
jgi:hypothetical protein